MEHTSQSAVTNNQSESRILKLRAGSANRITFLLEVKCGGGNVMEFPLLSSCQHRKLKLAEVLVRPPADKIKQCCLGSDQSRFMNLDEPLTPQKYGGSQNSRPGE